MLVQPNYIVNQNYKPTCTPQRRIINYGCDSVSFTSHTQVEKIFKDGYKFLVHQTAFDREPQTKEFVCNYIKDNFGHKNKIKIVSGGCSTGEEPVSYSMRLYDMRNKVDILGIDLGKDAIKQAKSRKYTFEIPKNNFDFPTEMGIESPYTDTYLVSDSDKGLNASQKMFKSLFKEFFVPTEKKIKKPFWEWFYDLMDKRNGYNTLDLERKEYRLKDGMAENCKFICDDINNIDKILGEEKADVISFNNALYHLTTEESYTGERVALPESEEIIEELMTKFKNCLNKDGIVVFGEDEAPQLVDKTGMVPKIMKKLGFTPLNKTEHHEANVWKKR